MSAVFKDKQGVVLISDEPYFDAESATRYRDQSFAGSKARISSRDCRMNFLLGCSYGFKPRPSVDAGRGPFDLCLTPGEPRRVWLGRIFEWNRNNID
jgi:hypothetical protein